MSEGTENRSITVAECQRNKEECYKFNIKPIMDEIKEIKDKIGQLTIDLAILPEKLIEKLDARYADKKTEKNVDKLMWLVLTAVVLAVLDMILRK